MKYYSVEKFLAERLPLLIANVGRLEALFASYNCVGEYASGEISYSNSNLGIYIRNGNYVPNIKAAAKGLQAIGAGDAFLALEASEINRQAACKAQADIERGLEIFSPADTDKLAVIYAGLRAFEEALAFSRQLKEKASHLKLVILTCDCDIKNKSKIIKSLISSGEIDSVIVTSECGGRMAMQSALEGLVNYWPHRMIN